MNSENTAVGIDLGTTNSCVAVYQNGSTEVVQNEFNERTTPSFVTICGDGTERYVGKKAKNYEARNIQNTIYESKRLMGQKFWNESVQDKMLHWPFEVVEDDEGNSRISVNLKHEKGRIVKKTYRPEEIGGLILEKLKGTAENYLGFEVKKAVITVPAYFNDNQRQATIDAGRIANLEVLKLINEPTAATFTYILENEIDKACNTMVFDLGGGTFDVSIIHSNNYDFKVIAVNGDLDLGGADFDVLLYNEIIHVLENKTDLRNLHLKENQIRRIMSNCVVVKEQLSHSLKAKFDLPEILPGFDFEHEFTREEFERLISHLIKKMVTIVKATLNDAKMSVSDIDNVVFVGGSTKIPAVIDSLRELFKKDISFAVNPDEAVARGAAYQAAILTNNFQHLKLTETVTVTDVTPLSLGVEIEAEKMNVIIPKNTPLPASASKKYTTMFDNQNALRVTVFQGENTLICQNTKLGHFDLLGIPPAPARTPRIIVTFAVDTNGILKISATETVSNETKDMTINTVTGRISTQELEEIKRENRESWRKEKVMEKIAEEKNELLKFCYDLKRTVQALKTVKEESKRKFLECLEDVLRKIEKIKIGELQAEIIQSERRKIEDKYQEYIIKSY